VHSCRALNELGAPERGVRDFFRGLMVGASERHNSDVEADVAFGRCAPSGPRSLTPVVMQTPIAAAFATSTWRRVRSRPTRASMPGRTALAGAETLPRSGTRGYPGSMTPAELEVRVRDMVEQVQAQRLPEDDFVELKADWIEPPRAARRLAAHANTARGEPILWLIGLDEKKGVVATTRQEPSEWLSQVEKFFDGPAPRLVMHRILPFNSGSVTALLFATDEGPYVVTDGVSGKAGTFSREVPWRDGVRTRSAHRADLLRLLVPLQRLPLLDVVGGHVRVWREQDGGRKRAARVPGTDEAHNILYRIELGVFVTPWNLKRICFPYHQVRVEIEAPVAIALDNEVELRAERSETSSAGPMQTTLSGAGVLVVRGAALGPDIASEATLSVCARLRPAGFAASAVARARMTPRTSKMSAPSQWWAVDTQSGYLDGLPEQEKRWPF